MDMILPAAVVAANLFAAAAVLLWRPSTRRRTAARNRARYAPGRAPVIASDGAALDTGAVDPALALAARSMTDTAARWPIWRNAGEWTATTVDGAL